MMKDSPIRKIGFDLLTLIDMTEAEGVMGHLWYGEAENDMTLSEYGAQIFAVMRPRPGALGVLRDLRNAGCRLTFFTDITDPRTGDRAERWLQEWSNVNDLVLHQIWLDKGQSPVMVDCQAYVLAQGHSYEIPKGRPRIGTHKKGGPFDPEMVEKLR